MKSFLKHFTVLLMTVMLSVQITIAGNSIPYASEVDVSSSWKENGDFATIKMPRSLKFAQKSIVDIVQRGDTVTIKAGYNNELETIFVGYVARVNPEIPLTIECEDEIYLLKKNNVTNKFFDNANLRQIIQHIAPTHYAAERVRDIRIGDFLIKDATAAKVLQVIREEYGLPSFFRDGKLYSGACYFDTGKDATFDTSKNMRESNLKFSTGDVKLKVKCVGILANGDKITADYGDEGGSTRTFLYDNISSKKELEKLAKERHSQTKLNGYSGDFTAWGLPIARHGDNAIIKDAAFSEDRKGKYLIDAAKINITRNGGYKRTYTLGAKVV